LFGVFAKKQGLDTGLPPLDCTKFRSPKVKTQQMWLF
jgi:hypothetical protein